MAARLTRQLLVEADRLDSVAGDTEFEVVGSTAVSPSFRVVGVRRRSGGEITREDAKSLAARHPGAATDIDLPVFPAQAAGAGATPKRVSEVARGDRTGWRGAGTTIAVIDFFGVKPHSEFQGRLSSFDASGVEVVSWAGSPDGAEGTAVASVAAGATTGAAPEAEILSYRAQTGLDVLKALAHIRSGMESGVPVRSIVTACEFGAHGPIRDQLEKAILELRQRGAVFVTAIGNFAETSGIHRSNSLASCRGVIAVGAYEKVDNSDPVEATARDQVHFWSSYGDPVPPGGWAQVRGSHNAAPAFLCWAGPYVVAGAAPGTTSDWSNAGNTSMAAAFAAGSMASWFGRAPHLHPDDIDTILAEDGVCQTVLDYYGAAVAEPEAQGFGALRPSKARAALEKLFT